MITENELIKARIKLGEGMSDEDFFAKEITTWQSSSERENMLIGKEYYLGNHDILSRQRTAIGKDGALSAVENIPNNKIVDNRFAKILDQKKNYLLGKPLTLRSDEESYYKELKKIFDPVFMRALKLAGEEALIGGIAWLYPYIDSGEKLRFKIFSSHEICPFWADSAHTVLDSAARVYEVELYENTTKKTITKVDLFGLEGIKTYELKDSSLIVSEEIKAYVSRGDESYGWSKIPLIPIKSNPKEVPLINKVKSLQDALNLLMSDFLNNMEENVRNTILVLKNYDGTDLGEFRKNLSAYGAIKTRTMEGSSGGVDLLRIEVNSENYKTICDLIIKAIVQNAGGFDSKDTKASGNPNQLNIRSIYSDIDLDANDMEAELQAAFCEMLEFVNMYLLATKGMNCEEMSAEIIFNRDILINETEAIENCVKSMSLLSKETLIAQHPWIIDPIKENELIKKQEEKIKEEKESEEN